jgi:hypothetical protein
MHIIRCFDFANRLLEISVFIDHSLSGIQNQGVRDGVLKRWMNGVPELIRDRKLYEKEPPEEWFKETERKMQESFAKKLEKSGLLILNISLVMLCTIVEIFLDHVLRTIFDANPRTLLSISPYKNITLEEFLNFKDYNDILENFKDKYLEHFNRQGIEKKLEVMYSLGLKKEILFSWRVLDDEAQKRFKGIDDRLLIDIFDKRHSIVHKNALPITAFEEQLLKIKDFFSKVILNFGFEAAEQFKSYGIITDFAAMWTGISKP